MTPEYDLLEVDPLAEEEPSLDVMKPSNPLLVEVGDHFGVIQRRASPQPPGITFSAFDRAEQEIQSLLAISCAISIHVLSSLIVDLY